ncbi:MAG TPA: hypothetical protein VGG33_26655 [Polyangia bacterium]
MAPASQRFVRYELRTLDLEKARAFYQAVFGSDFWRQPPLSLSQLPERAVAMGAPAHWLGMIGVSAFDRILAGVLGAGAQPLGPRRDHGGVAQAAFRDPFGAVLGMTSEAPAAEVDPVAWRMLHVHDDAHAMTWYAAQFGWVAREADTFTAHDNQTARRQSFAWGPEEDAAGSVANTARLTGVHTHWLYYFRVPNLADAAARVQDQGGTTLPAAETASGDRLAACEDSQGAAFGLFQSSAHTG